MFVFPPRSSSFVAVAIIAKSWAEAISGTSSLKTPSSSIRKSNPVGYPLLFLSPVYWFVYTSAIGNFLVYLEDTPTLLLFYVLWVRSPMRVSNALRKINAHHPFLAKLFAFVETFNPFWTMPYAHLPDLAPNWFSLSPLDFYISWLGISARISSTFT